MAIALNVRVGCAIWRPSRRGRHGDVADMTTVGDASHEACLASFISGVLRALAKSPAAVNVKMSARGMMMKARGSRMSTTG